MTKSYPTIHFATATDFEQWLILNHNKEAGLWMECYKKTTGIPSVSVNEALDVALCYGWIDSLVRRLDDERYVRKYTQRSLKSTWSERNKMKVLKLMDDGRMTKAGLLRIPSYRESGRIEWQDEKEAPITDQQINELLTELGKYPAALTYFEYLPASERLNYVKWIFQVKSTKIRQKRLMEVLEIMKSGQAQ